MSLSLAANQNIEALYQNFMRLTPELLTETLKKINTLTSIHADIMNQINGNTGTSEINRKKPRKAHQINN